LLAAKPTSKEVLNLPNYEMLADGKPRRIEITRKGEKSFVAKVDDRPHNIELQTDRFGPAQVFTIKIDGKAFNVELSKVEHGRPISVKVEEATFKVEVKTPSRKQAITSFEPKPMAPTRKTGASKQQTAVEGAITAPMTGRIIAVKVRKDELVQPNQVLCIIEAMKMESEITALKAGIVQEANVVEGQPVNEGDTLFIIA
jgi:biotin carboxyl carrier protein